MKHLYKITESTFNSVHEEQTEEIVAIGTDYETGIIKMRAFFEENKPEDKRYKIIVNDEDCIIAERYDEKTKIFDQYMVAIEMEMLDF